MLDAHRNALEQLGKLKDQIVTALVGAILVFVKHTNKERKTRNTGVTVDVWDHEFWNEADADSGSHSIRLIELLRFGIF